ncbi:hypothetical protein [Ancylobacter lacus]|uniref:hypothetical protein n=1 Tax=Ancylobacter lacus TaxID=2579970 RepID=UPI001BCC2F85|nr:hypothetical protein [Ancylobacter lacus]MBS7538022.1 hypothetical protein [Ancylobacter lacus]
MPVPAEPFGQPGENEGAHQHRHADERMEGPADRDVERHPWQVEHGERTGPGKEAADGLQVARRLQAVAGRASRLPGVGATAAARRQRADPLEHPALQPGLQRPRRVSNSA